jgi:uncharacterized protein (TIGR02246 family)
LEEKMKNSTVVCGAALMALLLTNCNQAAPDTRDADAKSLRDNETQWNQDWVSKDIDKLMAHYADDAVLMTTGGAASSGKDAIRKAFGEMVRDPAMSLKFQPSKVEVSKAGDIGFTQGSYTLTVTDPQSKKVVNDHGSYVTTYRKQPDGAWKAVSDIATSEVPPPAPPPPSPAKK